MRDCCLACIDQAMFELTNPLWVKILDPSQHGDRPGGALMPEEYFEATGIHREPSEQQIALNDFYGVRVLIYCAENRLTVISSVGMRFRPAAITRLPNGWPVCEVHAQDFVRASRYRGGPPM